MHGARHQPSDMSHVDHQLRANLIGNLPHPRKIPDARIRARSADDRLRLLALGNRLQLVVVDRLGILAHRVKRRPVELTAEAQLVPMRQMPAMRQIEPQNRVPMLQNGHISRRIGLRTRMRLHIRVNCHSRHGKKLLGPVPSEIFNHVRILAAAVIPLPRIPFGILVRKHRTGSL